ncbi:hypothetical protein OSCI_2920003 [Kamptonema sp. PCC 6506]|nr:hypothetical protein OSCI_2920003 [Kamptonema sp. PCC 6506]
MSDRFPLNAQYLFVLRTLCFTSVVEPVETPLTNFTIFGKYLTERLKPPLAFHLWTKV